MEQKYGWLIQPVPRHFTQDVIIEWIMVCAYLDKMKKKHPDGGIPFFRYITAEEATWLIGKKAYEFTGVTLLYIYQEVDLIAEAMHGNTL